MMGRQATTWNLYASRCCVVCELLRRGLLLKVHANRRGGDCLECCCVIRLAFRFVLVAETWNAENVMSCSVSVSLSVPTNVRCVDREAANANKC